MPVAIAHESAGKIDGMSMAHDLKMPIHKDFKCHLHRPDELGEDGRYQFVAPTAHDGPCAEDDCLRTSLAWLSEGAVRRYNLKTDAFNRQIVPHIEAEWNGNYVEVEEVLPMIECGDALDVDEVKELIRDRA